MENLKAMIRDIRPDEDHDLMYDECCKLRNHLNSGDADADFDALYTAFKLGFDRGQGSMRDLP